MFWQGVLILALGSYMFALTWLCLFHRRSVTPLTVAVMHAGILSFFPVLRPYMLLVLLDLSTIILVFHSDIFRQSWETSRFFQLDRYTGKNSRADYTLVLFRTGIFLLSETRPLVTSRLRGRWSLMGEDIVLENFGSDRVATLRKRRTNYRVHEVSKEEHANDSLHELVFTRLE